MSVDQRSRVLRGTAAASVSTFIALFAHSAVSSHAVSWQGILGPLILSMFVCIALAGRNLTLPRLALAVGASQLAFHALFTWGTPGSADAATTSDVLHTGVAFWIAHSIAAIVTVIILHRGESAVVKLARLISWTFTRFARALALRSVTDPEHRTTLATYFTWVRPDQRHLVGAVVHRGPPSFV